MKTLREMKKFRKGVAIMVIVLSALIFLRYSISFISSFINYNYNKNLAEPTGLISEQDDYENFRFGFGDVGANGCGAVAVYNILKLEGKEANFAGIIKDMEGFGTNFFGLLGGDPLFLVGYLQGQGFKCHVYVNNFEENAKDSKYVIFTGVHSTGGHYWLMENNNDGRYKLHNPDYASATFDFVKECYADGIEYIITVD